MIAFGHNPRVEIRREPGLYIFLDYAAMGKSYLARMIGLACEGGMPYVPYTYLDYVRGLDLTSACERCRAELVMVDQYDLYWEDAALRRQIEEIAKRAVVLVDLKDSDVPLEPDDYVGIERTENLLEVS